MLEEKNIFIGGVEFTPDRKTLVQFPENLEIQNYIVPDGTEEIGIKAFFNCQQLQTVTLPQPPRYAPKKRKNPQSAVVNSCG